MPQSDSFAQKQKKALLSEKQKLEKKIKELDKFPDYGRGDDDNARELSDFENNLSIENQFKILLKKTDAALKSIEKGTYGQCSKCKSEIEKGRLESMPYADVCVVCHTKKK